MEAAMVRWMGRVAERRFGRDPHAFDAAATRRTVERLDRAGRWLRWLPVDARGLDRIPESPVMLVMNHSGGTSIPDVWGFLFAWYKHFGVSRPIHPLAHELILGQPVTGRYLERRGVLLAEHGVARAALAAGHDVLVLPGGDQETWRTWWDRWRVDFAGRTGYARLARAAGVRVVPVAHAGAHETLMVLWRGDRLARRLGLHRLARAEIWPVHLSLPWGLAVGPLPHIPWPTRMRYRCGDPIEPDASDLDARVRGAVQVELDELRRQDLLRGP